MYYEYAPDPYMPVDLQDLSPAAECCLCGDVLFLGQCCYRLEGALVCDRCLSDYARAYFRSDRVRLLAAPES